MNSTTRSYMMLSAMVAAHFNLPLEEVLEMYIEEFDAHVAYLLGSNQGGRHVRA